MSAETFGYLVGAIAVGLFVGWIQHLAQGPR
jgi:hypothetical protein